MPPTLTIDDAGSPGTSTSILSVTSSGSCASSVWVGSQPPSANSVTRKCGLAPCACATALNGHGSAMNTADDRPSLRAVRRVSSSSQGFRMSDLFTSVEDDLRAPEHGRQHPAPCTLARVAGHRPEAGPALRLVLVQRAIELEPDAHLRRVRRHAPSVEAAHEVDD